MEKLVPRIFMFPTRPLKTSYPVSEISYIYALSDPDSPRTIRYIGQTVDPIGRLRRHKKLPKKDKRTHRGNWITKLAREGKHPLLTILFIVPRSVANSVEIELIQVCKDIGVDLVNGSLGGDGGALLPEIQARVNDKVREQYRSGVRHPPTLTAEQKEKRDIESSARMLVNNPMKNPEIIAKNKATNREKWDRIFEKTGRRRYVPQYEINDPEYITKRKERLTAQNRNPTIIAKRSKTLKGKKKSAEHVKNMSEYYNRISPYFLEGERVSIKEAARRLSMRHQRLRRFVQDGKGDMQSAIDYFSKMASLPR